MILETQFRRARILFHCCSLEIHMKVPGLLRDRVQRVF